MSIAEISQRLRDLASKLEGCKDLLNNKQGIEETDRFIKALQRYEKVIGAIAQGESPSAIECRQMMRAHFNEETSSIAELADFSKKVLGKKTPLGKGASYSEYLAKVTAEIITKGKADLATTLLKRLLASPVLDLSNKGTESLLLQIRKMGSLTEEQLEVERNALLKNPEMLFLLAKTAGVRFKPTNKPETILKKLIDLSKRYYENTIA